MDVKTLHEAAKAKYWQDRDLAGARRLLEEGIALARQHDLKGEEKAMQYDLASFCWIGWDEPGVLISLEDESVGSRAAEENLRLAQELERPSFPMSNAWWMVGAYRFQEGDFGGAREAFEEFRLLAEGDPVRTLLADGYIEMTKLFQCEPSDMDSVCSKLRGMDGDGAAYADQLDSAMAVLGNRWFSEGVRRHASDRR